MTSVCSSERLVGERTRLVALVCLYAMALGAVWSPPMVQLAETIILGITAVQVYRAPSVFLRSTLFWLTVFFVGYVVVRGVVAVFERPDLSALHWEGVRRWTKAGPLPVFCTAVAMSLVDDRYKHFKWLLLVALVAFTVNLLDHMELGPLVDALEGRGRYTFSRHTAFMSLLFSVSVLGLLIFWPVSVWRAQINPRLKLLLWGAGLAFLLFYLAALVAGGARASWLATCVGLLVVVCVGGFHMRSRMWALFSSHWRLGVSVATVLLAVGLFLGQVFSDQIAGRIARFGDTPIQAVQVVLGERDIESLPRGPVGTRLAYNIFGLRKLAERPLFGYGPAEPRYLRVEHDVPHQLQNRNDPFHSQYVDPMLRFGIVGYLPVVAIFVFAVRGTLRGWSEQRVGGDYVLFVLAFVAIYAVWSLADQRFANFTMIAIVSLILGSGCSFLYRRPGPLESRLYRSSESPTTLTGHGCQPQ